MSYLDIDALPIVLVDDEPAITLGQSLALQKSGLDNVTTIQDSRNVMSYLAEHGAGVLLLDLNMPHVSGQTLLRQVAEKYPEIPVIVMTAVDDLGTAVSCMKDGAIDYLLKPFDNELLVMAVRRGLERRVMRADLNNLKAGLLAEAPGDHDAFDTIITQDKKMLAMFRYVTAIAKSPNPVLITGESGTGKSELARAIHRLSGRPGELVETNVAGIDDQFFTDKLFGHVKGAYNGAPGRIGKVQQAGRGTLFLDEIGDLSLGCQVKLLELLQEGTFEMLGSVKKERCLARIVAATNRDLPKLVAEGRFRADLYFRLDIHHVKYPPLRERKGDLALLVPFLLNKAAQDCEKAVPTPPAVLLPLLQSYDWPGNVRQLQNMIDDAVAQHAGGVLSTQSFRDKMGSELPDLAAVEGAMKPAIVFPEPLPTIDEATEALIQEAMRLSSDNQRIAARMLGLTRQALNRRIARARTKPSGL
jgi:DNA-binding NtrC family response regulator